MDLGPLLIGGAALAGLGGLHFGAHWWDSLQSRHCTEIERAVAKAVGDERRMAEEGVTDGELDALRSLYEARRALVYQLEDREASYRIKRDGLKWLLQEGSDTYVPSLKSVERSVRDLVGYLGYATRIAGEHRAALKEALGEYPKARPMWRTMKTCATQEEATAFLEDLLGTGPKPLLFDATGQPVGPAEGPVI